MHKNNTSTLYRRELKERILDVAMQQFRLKGIKAVKMDDIAGLLSISKRTLYEIYANKEDLLMAGIRIEDRQHYVHINDFVSKPENNIMDILIEELQIKLNSLSNINPLFFIDMHKYGNITKYLADKHAENDNKAKDFYLKGVEEGFFRADLDYDIITNIINATMSHIMSTQMYKEYDMQKIFYNVILLYVRGICTSKGLGKIDTLVIK